MNSLLYQPPVSALNCYTIPAAQPFLRTLAQWILTHYGMDVTALPRLLVLLPSRRACRSLREAFLECAAGHPLLLPRIQPIGDIDEELTIYHGTLAAETLPAPIAAIRRELLLTRLVKQFEQDYNIEQAAALAKQLAAFIDDTQREGLSFDRLSALVPEELALHWQQTVDFLELVSKHWPQILSSEGAVDPVTYRNMALAALAKAWETQPPSGPVIAAGSTGSLPATANLLATIARLHNGRVVLPGLDKAMPEEEWKLISETHPQFALKKLLDVMRCKRSEVKYLNDDSILSDRSTCIQAILQPPEATSEWANAHLPLERGLEGVKRLTTDTLLDESRMIAVALRETLETPGKRAALITPDRTLARMVVSQMQRFGIAIDDSAGVPLSHTPVGCFLRLIADMTVSKAAPASLLAVLRHPLAAIGYKSSECRRLSRLLETQLLRGLRKSPGLGPLMEAAKDKPELHRFLQKLDNAMRPLMVCFEQKSASLRFMLEAHMALAEQLAASDAEGGAQQLWSGEAGSQMAAFLAELLQHADIVDYVDPVSYPAFLETLLAGQTYRPAYGQHPRLHIFSPMEARLLHFDRIILGSLNEGTWPSLPQADPWMSRPMRKTFGLPAAERAIGQSAHDIYMLCAHAPEVLLTRAGKVEGAPTVASRWLVRLETLVGGLDRPYFERMNANAYYGQAKQLLDTPNTASAYPRPAPIPPVEARPRALRVTAIDGWIRDPYTIYARYILGLRKLEPLDAPPDAADIGTLVHKALELFIRRWPSTLPDDAYHQLLECGREAFASMQDYAAADCLWRPRFEGMAQWLIAQERMRRNVELQVFGELEGKWSFEVDGKAFTLTTRIDRLEMDADGTAVIADYKTGTVPSLRDVEKGLANQLLLESMIVLHGTLKPHVPPPACLTRLEYWKLSGQPERCSIQDIGVAGLATIQERLEQLIRMYDNPAQPYAAQKDPSKMLAYNDYAHLTRHKEWEAV